MSAVPIYTGDMATIAAHALTLEEFSLLPRDGQRHEMNEGKLVTMPPVKSLHTLVAHRILKALLQFVTERAHAQALFEAGYVLSYSPLTIRQPDLSVLSESRILATSPDSYFEGAPELAIEVVSPSDSAEDLELKAEQYLRYGGKEVWIVFPKTKTVHVYRAANSAQILSEFDTLDSAALPGFSIKAANLFPQ